MKDVSIGMTNYKYILKGKKPVIETDLMKWADWFEKAERHVAEDFPTKKIRVSTVFLALDHSLPGGEPVLFETMVFGGKLDGLQERYHTWKQAEEGHELILKKVLKTIKRKIKKCNA